MTWAHKFLVVACVWMLALGCQPRATQDVPQNVPQDVTTDGVVTVTGRLVSVKDDRPADGGIDLTVETENGKQEILRVGSAFIAGPREHVLALHAFVDSAKVGDRLRASGQRDSSGLMVERLENLH